MKKIYFLLSNFLTFKLLTISTYAAGIVGPIDPPPGVNKYLKPGDQGAGLFLFISNMFKLAAVVAGLIMIFQFIGAGFDYITASGDSKKTEAAFQKIWQSILGMIIIASAFVLASVIGRITGIDIINPTIYGPK